MPITVENQGETQGMDKFLIRRSTQKWNSLRIKNIINYLNINSSLPFFTKNKGRQIAGPFNKFN